MQPEPAAIPEPEAGYHRYYITPDALGHGSYPFMMGGQIHENKELADYEGGADKAYGYIDYPQLLTEGQINECGLAPMLTDEALFLVDDANYLHIQTSEEGYDYTIYDAVTQKEVDGGCLSNPNISLLEARKEIFAIHEMPAETVQTVDIEILETLQGAQMEAMPQPRRYAMDENGEVRRIFGGKFPEEFDEEDVKEFVAANEALLDSFPDSENFSAAMLPESPEQALDEYPLPDEDLKPEDLAQCGYLDGDLLPLSKDRAMELYEKDLTIYAILDGGKSEMVFDREDFELQFPVAMYAVSKEEWEESPDFHAAIQDRLNHQEERESDFLSHEGDCFAIYQLKDDDALRDIRFEGTGWLQSVGRRVEKDNYDLVYTAPLSTSGQPDAALEQLWHQFNNEHPADYHRPSMSVSDIVAVKQDGAVSCHYADSVGFTEVPDFIKTENYLKSAEMSAEDDYGMIDGIINNAAKQTVTELEQQARSGQPISLMDLADAVHREQKKSVVEQLKNQPAQETKKTAPKRSAEREI